MDANDCPVQTKCFGLKILMCISELQLSDKSNTGVSFDQITKYMEEKYQADGDVYTQVLTSMRQLRHKGFISKYKTKYKIVGAMARILLMSHTFKGRNREIQRIQRIFSYNDKSPEDCMSVKHKLTAKDDNKIEECEDVENKNMFC